MNSSVSIIHKVFINSNGDFNATSLTAVSAAVALIINTRIAWKGYKANLLSKTRIEWIEKLLC